MTTHIVGIDPGKTGGIVSISIETGEIEKMAMPIRESNGSVDGFLLSAFLGTFKRPYVYIEKVHSMPGQGVASTFKFGMVFGQVLGVIDALKLPYSLVSPREWTAHAFKGIPCFYSGKERNKIAYIQKYPDLDLLATKRSRKAHEGLIDALLIADYGLNIRKDHEKNEK